jgi:hypothetical protein
MLREGDEVGPYVVEELLGGGGMALVYGARHSMLHNRRVALKVLQTHLAEHPRALERFIDEGRVQASLQSSHIVEVYDVLPWRKSAVLVMRRIDGRSIADALEQRGPFREEYDMLGHVWEWTNDGHDPTLSGGRDPLGRSTSSNRVLRGGSWDNGASAFRTGSRNDYADRGVRVDSIGFRLARSAHALHP